MLSSEPSPVTSYRLLIGIPTQGAASIRAHLADALGVLQRLPIAFDKRDSPDGVKRLFEGATSQPTLAGSWVNPKTLECEEDHVTMVELIRRGDDEAEEHQTAPRDRRELARETLFLDLACPLLVSARQETVLLLEQGRALWMWEAKSHSYEEDEGARRPSSTRSWNRFLMRWLEEVPGRIADGQSPGVSPNLSPLDARRLATFVTAWMMIDARLKSAGWTALFEADRATYLGDETTRFVAGREDLAKLIAEFRQPGVLAGLLDRQANALVQDYRDSPPSSSARRGTLRCALAWLLFLRSVLRARWQVEDRGEGPSFEAVAEILGKSGCLTIDGSASEEVLLKALLEIEGLDRKYFPDDHLLGAWRLFCLSERCLGSGRKWQRPDWDLEFEPAWERLLTAWQRASGGSRLLAAPAVLAALKRASAVRLRSKTPASAYPGASGRSLVPKRCAESRRGQRLAGLERELSLAWPGALS